MTLWHISFFTCKHVLILIHSGFVYIFTEKDEILCLLGKSVIQFIA
jgi:hypothetical protein